MMKYLRAFGTFWYDLIIGDDWKIAVAVVVALGAAAATMMIGASDVVVTIVGSFAVLLGFIAALMIDQAGD